MVLFLTGFLVGIASLIHGISGGTIVILLNQFEKVTNCISNIKTNKKEVFLLVLGIILGALSFGKIIEFLFLNFPNETIFLFCSLVLFSLPKLIKEEKEKSKIKPLYLIIGFVIIIALNILAIKSPKVITNYPRQTLPFLILFSLCGALDGALTIFPGISGSMTMMVLGPYYLYKSYIANLSLSNIKFIVPLLFYFIGDMTGIYIGSKISLFALKKYRDITMSLIYGLIISSIFVLIPLDISLNFNLFIGILISITIAYILTTLLDLKE